MLVSIIFYYIFIIILINYNNNNSFFSLFLQENIFFRYPPCNLN